ncbi:hypothetical protein Ddye_028197 [Dipteronia dyeriana]|uniref:AAA+ ATPase domain-containing protein n=1 Tax=Dipteronia dyeriana TaxID=168575 RepID=A0AAD9TQK2_9ROSI|nr:hypothetical protein Ddye_028197 [Dipteronia dyeriana]
MTEICIAVAGNVVGKIAEYLVAPISLPFSYLWNYKSNVENLKKRVKMLEGRRDSVQHLVEAAGRNGRETLQHIKNWQEIVDQIIPQALEVINEDNPEQTNIQFCKRFSCPNLKNRYQLSKKAADKLKDVVVFEQEAAGFKEVSYTTIPEQTSLQPSKGHKAFESRKSILKGIIDALLDPNVNMVGIYGMGGVGKTTLAKEVASEAKEHKLFDKIVFVEVSESPDIKIIQGVIADNLGLHFNEESVPGRADRLCEQLKKEGKILLILDNIWGRINFEKVGIPFENNHKGLKLLLTTRSHDVLTNDMDSQHNFHVQTLNEPDAWSLFKSIAGTCTEQHDLQSIAPEVAKECGGIPVAIVAIARALKNKKIYEWKNALRELKNPSSKSFEGIVKEVYTSIKLSYDYLENKELKEIFLLCSRMGHTYNASIQELFRYGWGLGLFENCSTLEEALCYVYVSINKLKATSLLLEAPESEGFVESPVSERFAMHDVICDIAKSIANVLTVIDVAISQLRINGNTLRNCTSITLHNIDKLPKDLELVCPQLKLLYVKLKYSTFRIPDNFFTRMLGLQVLHLIEINLHPLPTSLSCLLNLQTLCLDQCKLGDIAVIGDLKKLEILSFYGSNINKLPEELCILTRLRLLDLSDCSKLSVIHPKVMSSFSKLEALYMGNTSIQWEVERPNIERSNISIDELKHLRYLTLLEIHIPNPKMSKGLLSTKLERYKIFVGDKWYQSSWRLHSKTSRVLKISLDTTKDGIISQLKGIEELELGEVLGVTNLLDALDRSCFPTLKHLNVKSSSQCSCIIESCDALPSLESLILSFLGNLEKICNSPLGANTFLRLRTVEVDRCPKLNNIFSSSTVMVLLQLEEIKVSECDNMKEIFAIGGQDDANNIEVVNEIKLSQLRIMKLWCLPQLKSLCYKVKTPSALQLPSKIISEDEIDIPSSLFNKKVVFPNLQTLDIHEMHVEKIWHNLHPKLSSSIQNLTELIVYDCGNLKELFSSSTGVTEEAREEDMRDTIILFPKLNRLEIENLEKLTTLWPGYYIEFPLLKELTIQECPELEAFIFDEKVRVPSLEEMQISNMDNLKMIWHNQLDGDSFHKLKSLEVDGCQKLLTVLPLNIRGRSLSLESLIVRSCGSLEGIFDLQGIISEERNSIAATQSRELCFSNLQELEVSECQSLKYLFAASNVANDDYSPKVLFPKLTSMELSRLPELRSFHPGRQKVDGPVLIRLELCDCGIHDTDEGQMQMQQLLFFAEQAFPCLDELKLAGENVMMIWQGQNLQSSIQDSEGSSSHHLEI